jgi:hypothetical protein
MRMGARLRESGTRRCRGRWNVVDIGKHFDTWSLLVMVLTLVLFVIALYTKGFTHDLLLEAGVFLVSVKLLLMAYKHSIATNTMQQKLDALHSAVQRLGATRPPPHVPPPSGHDSPAGQGAGPPAD